VAWRWGIVGPGGIAERFARDMALVDDGVITAVASRSLERANTFADRHGIVSRYDSAQGVYEDPAVDVVYIATPHARHLPEALAALECGKHVLCEKPMALSARETTAMVDAARTRGLFLIEAMWTRFLPSYRALVAILEEGRIGEPLVVEADFGLRVPFDPAHRLFDPALGGGATLDLGVYPVQLCSLVLGTPDRVTASGTLCPSGVDDLSAAVVHYPGGQLGIVKSALRVGLSCRARIAGTAGSIEIPSFMHRPRHLDVYRHGERDRIETPHDGDGIRFQVNEVHRCLDAGLIESAVMPLDETLGIAATLDAIRDDLGVVYPGEARSAGQVTGVTTRPTPSLSA
jgi:predicted dehydrogenase